MLKNCKLIEILIASILMKSIYIFSMILTFNMNIGFAQGNFVIQNKKHTDKIKFELIHNLIVFPLEINGVELSFLLDTGVSKPIIFNFLNLTDTLQIKESEKIFLRGLGDGDSIEAIRSDNNVLKIGEAININQQLYAVYNTNLDFAPRLGVPIHGIIGFDLFKDFIVEINYDSKYIRLTEPNYFKNKKCRKCESFNLEFYNNKPYINLEVIINKKLLPVKLLIDTGGSDALWLFEKAEKNVISGQAYFEDYLGQGLSGSIYGKRSTIEGLILNDIYIERPNVAFPDSTSIFRASKFKERSGSLAGGILKRFNIIFDYQNAKITIKKNRNFDKPFYYNKSGIELVHDGLRLVQEESYENTTNNLSKITTEGVTNPSTKIVIQTKYKLALKPAYTIVEIRKDSPAEKAGLKVGDVILMINNKETYHYKLQDIIEMFYGKDGKLLKFKVDRNGIPLDFELRLEDVLKKKTFN